MKNPLRKRLLRELRSDFGKYAVIFLLLVLSISEISGFLVAAESMIAAYDESFEKYNIEDGNFTAEEKMSPRRIRAVEELDISVYELFYSDQTAAGGQTIRIFKMREDINLACLMDGSFPEAENEIALDRMFADNNGLRSGDAIEIGGKRWLISGLVALSDYSTMFENNNDMMFDSKMFGVSVVTPEAFSQIPEEDLVWRYAWKYDAFPATTAEEIDVSDALAYDLNRIVPLTGFVPRYANQAIMFTGDDIGSDRAGMTMFLYIIIVIIAFVFTVTTSNTIVKEAGVIGTLRSMGYTKKELIRHFMTLPVIVSLAAALAGNVLGYTVLKKVNADLYYGSYSLPTYVTLWNASAFIETTVVPLALMLIINFLLLSVRLRYSPLQFLRRDLTRKKKSRAVRLPRFLPFFSRFRLRIFFQNISNYVLLFVGILFANTLLMFGLMFPDVLQNYQESVPDDMLVEHQYVLQLPAGAVDEDNKVSSLLEMLYFESEVDTENEDAEKFSAYTLKTLKTQWIKDDEVLLYGIVPNSRYLNLSLKEGDVYISGSFAEKEMLSPGDSFTMKEVYEDDTYDFTVTGIYPYHGALCIFMRQDDLNGMFDLGEDNFSGYFSETPITDIDRKYIGQEIDYSSLTKVSRQLTISMGGMMKVVDAFAVIMFVIMIYLMSKIIIEKNAQSISMTKILGYSDSEISRLYILVTSIYVIAVMVLSIPPVSAVIQWLFAVIIRMEMSGWIPFRISNAVYRTMILMGSVSYLLIAALEYRKVRGVPMGDALKNTE